MDSKTTLFVNLPENEVQTIPTSKNEKFSFPSKQSTSAFAASLTVTTIAFVAALIVNTLAFLPIADKLGFKNTTSEVSDMFYTQVTPAWWTFAVWSAIYVWQAAWIGYGWTFVLQDSSAVVPFSTKSLILYALVNVCNVIWIYLWGNELPQYSYPVLFILELLLYASIRNEAQHIFQIEQSANYYTVVHKDVTDLLGFNLNFARNLILNGMSMYATWITVANLINLAIVLQYYGPFSAALAGTISLVLLGADVVIYFVLENTLIGNFSRYVFVVYPTFSWALFGVLYAHANEMDCERNELITLLLLVGSAILCIGKLASKY